MISLGSYTFVQNPDYCTQPLKKRRCNDLETLGGMAFFSWGLFVEGQEIQMKWKWMATSQFNSLYALLVADAQVVWDPETGDTYNVEIKSLTGDYHLSTYAAAANKKNVVMKLVIISKVV